MTRISRTAEAIGKVGVMTVGYMVTSTTLHLDSSSWMTLLLGSALCSLLTCGVLAVIDRLISS